jgi:plasmid stabilization system protein ParE
MYPVVFVDLRRALVRRFPYAVFYEVEPERIVVYAVFHCSQDPDKWKARFLN